MWDKLEELEHKFIKIIGGIIYTVIIVGFIVTSLISIYFGVKMFWDMLVQSRNIMKPFIPLSEMHPAYVKLIVANTLGLIGFMGAFLFIFFGYGFNEKREDKDK